MSISEEEELEQGAQTMDKIDLSLIPIDELLREAESRCSTFVAGMRMKGNDDQGGELKFFYGQGKFSEAVGITGILHNDVLNNWNGELELLQRLKRDEEEGA